MLCCDSVVVWPKITIIGRSIYSCWSVNWLIDHTLQFLLHGDLTSLSICSFSLPHITHTRMHSCQPWLICKRCSQDYIFPTWLDPNVCEQMTWLDPVLSIQLCLVVQVLCPACDPVTDWTSLSTNWYLGRCRVVFCALTEFVVLQWDYTEISVFFQLPLYHQLNQFAKMFFKSIK